MTSTRARSEVHVVGDGRREVEVEVEIEAEIVRLLDVLASWTRPGSPCGARMRASPREALALGSDRGIVW